ncbi:hypothetical protein [Mucilaginibacter celer]|uniref:DUF4268 domain-containing protein n=1 Tax=Mucilaginibacter celer TaxID=2305508 RepID=A0A494VYJ9_9SPHI|nr:hypothetical protein [Mucilaginibacter celer]AYL96398.1 hypothetical protein HYN43_014315 [Mucilaginibacter celer]
MDSTFYLSLFRQAVDELDPKLLHQKQLQVETGVWLNAVVLRLHKQHWANNPDAKPQTGPAIFFSIWISNAGIEEHKLFYNIHALKLSKLKGYALTSRKFAEDFREEFKSIDHNWPNVSMKFGPQTLMQGWKLIDLDFLKEDILTIVNKFIEIDMLIENLLVNGKVS